MSLKNVCLIIKIDTKLVSMVVELLQNIIHPPIFRQLSYITWSSLYFYGSAVRRQIYYNPFKCHPLSWTVCDFAFIERVSRTYDPLGYGIFNTCSSASVKNMLIIGVHCIVKPLGRLLAKRG